MIKRTFAVVSILLLLMLTSYGQQNTIYVGTSISLHHEIRNKMIYGPGLVNRTSATSFFGTGIRLQKKISHSWGVNTGIGYVKRHYEMIVPFNYCSFLEPGEGCPYLLAHTNKFGYKTAEVSLGVNKYLIAQNKVELYINLTSLAAFNFQSYYYSFTPAVGRKNMDQLNVYSTSLLSGLGYSYSLTERIKVTIEPFIRLIHVQRQDPILLTGHERRRTNFDNYGSHLLLMFRI